MAEGDVSLPASEQSAAAPAAFDRRIISVLFADIVGFTSLSERLDSEDVATIQDAYFAATRETVERYGGVVEKFIGDAAMAIFGAPRARDDDAERAVRAGLALISAIDQIAARLGLEPGELQLRVGVNTGEVVHAASGPDTGRVTGDTVNTAARLQTAARPGAVLIGELTALTVAEVIETRGIGAVDLKGKAEPMRVWEAVGARSQPSREEALGALSLDSPFCAGVASRRARQAAPRPGGHRFVCFWRSPPGRCAPCGDGAPQATGLRGPFPPRPDDPDERLAITQNGGFRLRAPMLGRSTELARLNDALARVVRERISDRCLIVAPPGVGKSRLLAEFAAVADATVLRARVRPQGTAPYETVAQLLRAAGGDLAAKLADAGVLPGRAAVILGEVGRLLEATTAAAGASGDLAAERDARFDAWVAALDALVPAASAWLVEDVHWAGGDLLAFLDHARSATTRYGRLVVVTARPSLLESTPAWCEGMRVDLGPLPAAAAEELVRGLVGTALSAELVAIIADRSDGTPLFIEELLRTWASVGTLVREGDAWHLAVQPAEVTLPQTVQAIYAAQIDDLPPDARLMARRGAVSGRRVPLAAFGALGLGEQRAGLDVLRRRALLADPLDDPITGESYAYRHALLRDAGYASLARAERARLHSAMARWLEDIAGERGDAVAEAIAEHYALALESLPSLAVPELPERATLAADAAAWYERAAEAALRLSALDAGRRLFVRSVELTAEAAPLDRARRRLRLGETLAASAELDRGIEELEAAREIFAAESEARDQYESSTFALGRAYMQQIRFPEATSIARAGIDHLGGDARDALTARLHALHAWSIAASGGVDGVLDEADAAWAAVRDGTDPLRALDVLELRCSARDELDFAGAEDWAFLEQRALRLERWHQVAVAGRARAMHLAFDDPRAALGPLADVVEVASAHGLTEQVGWGEYARCETLWVLGNEDAAIEVGLRALELAERYTYERLAFRTFMVLLQIGSERGDTALATRWDRWWAIAEPHFPPSPSPHGRVLRGAYPVWLARATGDPAPLPSPDLSEAIIPMVNPYFVGAVETIIRAWLDADRHDLASAAAKRWAQHAADSSATQLMRSSAALIDAWLTGSADSAGLAAELAAALPAPFWESRAHAAARGSQGMLR